MYRFSEAMYNPGIQTVDIGVGLTWENVCVVSGRVSGVGVAELTLGGGSFCYLWTPAGKSEHYLYVAGIQNESIWYSNRHTGSDYVRAR